jgi:hypothetical protein
MASSSAKSEELIYMQSQWEGFLRRIHWPENSSRHWRLIPTLIRQDPKAVISLMAIGGLITALTLLLADLALLREMSGLLSTNPLNVYAFIITFSFLVGAAILFYPFLLLNHRLQVYVEEEAEKLNDKYRTGMQQFQKEMAKNPQSSIGQILDKMGVDSQDFVYLYTTASLLEKQNCDEIDLLVEENKQTRPQAQREILRELIYATAWENLEDSAYSIGSYLMPVTYCMASIALGFMAFLLIPLLGTSTINVGGFSVNLIWAVGGFVGAYLYSFLPFFQRCTRRDLPPRAFLHYALNIFLGTLGVALFGNLFLESVPGSATQLALAAAIGSVPFWLLSVVRKQGIQSLNLEKIGIKKKKRGNETGRCDLCEIPGIEYDYAERLREEGIMNIQNLAFADIENLGKRTRLGRKMLYDWKDQAILMLLTGDIDINRLKGANNTNA